MKILVTGAHGFVGHHVAVALRAAGHTVIGTDRIKGARSDKKARIQALKKAGGVEFLECDLSKWDHVKRLVQGAKPQAIVHIAAQYSVPYKTENMKHYVASNLAAFTYIAEAASIVGVRRLVYASSVAVNDDGRPSGLYGATKAYNEHAAHAYAHRKKLETVGLRYGVVYGPMMRRDAEMYRTVRAYCQDAKITRTSQLEKNVAMIDIRDAAELTKAAVESELRARANVVPAYRDRASYAYVAKLCEQIVGRPAKLPNDVVIPAPMLDMSVPQTAARNALGLAPATALEDGVRYYLKWAERDAR